MTVVRASSFKGPLAGWALLVAASVFASWAVFRQLGGYDLAPLIDLFWRMKSGAVPGVDFINTLPPLLLLLAKVFAPFKFGWYELTLANIVIAWATFAALVALTPREDRSVGTCLALATAVAVPLVFTNHVWHSSVSQYAAAVFFLALFRGLETMDRASALWLAGTASVLALAKQNVALPVLGSSLSFVLVWGGVRRWRLAAAIGGGAAAGLLFAMLWLRMPLAAMLAIYTAVAGRSLPIEEMVEKLAGSATNQVVASLCLLAVVVMIPIILRPGRLSIAQRYVALLFVGLAALPFATDWDTKINNATLPFIVVLVVVIAGMRDGSARARSQMLYAQILTGALLSVALLGGAVRLRMYDVGPGIFWERVMSHRVERGYFGGLYTGDTLVGVLDGMERVRAWHPGQRLFFGPRLEFGYAVLRVPSPHGMPLWWHPGTSYALGDDVRVAQAFAANQFDRLIFLGDDRKRISQTVLNQIARTYRFVGTDGPLQIYEPIR
ncbi:MAG: hypothetical protein EOP21_05660 [Hyphomicrobiales bacterium]|nr:MAG: hypothetical protein EOP21_05660 [Hyphomicrobiales bacterium]